MKGLVAVAVLVSALLAASPALVPGSFPGSRSGGDILECEDFVEGDRVEVELEEELMGVEREMEIRFDADSRVRIEVEVETEDEVEREDIASFSDEPAHSGDDDEEDERQDEEEDEREEEREDEEERESRVELCGFVQFVDENDDGMLDASDTIVDTTLVEFGSITHTVENGVHVFEVESLDGSMTVTVRVPATFPTADESFIKWKVTAAPTCVVGATDFAVKLEQKDPVEMEQFFAGPCGSTLEASGEA